MENRQVANGESVRTQAGPKEPGDPRPARRRYFSVDADAWRLVHESIDEAVEEWWDQSDDPNYDDQLTVYEWHTRLKPALEPLGEWVLEQLLERLDCDLELGDPEEATKSTEAMKAAAVAFVRAALDEYVVWACEQVGTHEVRVVADETGFAIWDI